MKLARRSLTDPDRKLELEERLDEKVVDLIAEANDAGYGTEETLEALDEVVDNQKIIYKEDPDPADHPFRSGQLQHPVFPSHLANEADAGEPADRKLS